MNRRTKIDLAQNITIVLLGLSALFLLLLVISYETGQNGRLSTLSELVSSSPGTQDTSATSTDLTGLSAPFHLVVTNDYGRSGYLRTAGETAAEEATGLLREALGSAGEPAVVTEEEFRGALENPGIYFDYLTVLPASILSERMGTEFQYSGDVRQLLISASPGGTAVLYLRGGESVYRCSTAVSHGVLQEVLAMFTPNRAFFAFEGGEAYAHLDPYSVLWDGMITLPSLSAAMPALASDVDQLLTLLDFNPHTMSRYYQSDGTEVVMESPRSLRVQPDGVIVYSGDEEAASALYHVSSFGEEPTEAEAVLAVLQMSETLLGSDTSSVGALYLSHVEKTAQGFTVAFNYQVGGVPIYFSDGLDALSAEITGSTITSFTLRCRQYTILSESYSPLPARHAAAIALDYPGTFLTLGYVDQGGNTLYPEWLAK